MSTVKITRISNNPLITESLDYNAKPGQHQIGLLLATHNHSGENQWENKSRMTDEELQSILATNDPGVKCMKLSHHTQERGLFEASWYFAMYKVPSSLDLPTKMNQEYDGDITVEIVVAFEENGDAYTRIMHYTYQTSTPNELRFSDLSIEDMLEELMHDTKEGFMRNEDDPSDYTILMYDPTGNPAPIDITGVSDVVEGVVSIRLI